MTTLVPERRRSNLPAEVTSFIGRRRELSQVRDAPLALELAAVRLRAMSIEQIVARLDDRFLLLGTARSSDDRHQTLRAAIGWSHELCTAPEQRL